MERVNDNTNENMGKNGYTIVVSSCDDYSDLWYPFFKILKDEWDGLESIPIVLNTESKSFSYESLIIHTFNLYKDAVSISWTERLRNTLERIDTKYILFLLDDFFMFDRVKVEQIEEHKKWLDENPDVSVFCYKETKVSKNIRDNRFEGFERRPLFGRYKFNCQAALWRRDRLIEYLSRDEDPWEWEDYGNWRSFRHPSHRFYSAIEGTDRVFPYIYDLNGYPIGGVAVYRGKWYLPVVKPLFDRHGISIDYSLRGSLNEEDLKYLMGMSKAKENVPGWKRFFWVFRRPYSMMIKVCITLRNIRHFF